MMTLRTLLVLTLAFVLLVNTNGPSMAASSPALSASSIESHSNQMSQVLLGQSTDSFYNYEPYVTIAGSNYIDIPSSSELQLTKFTIAMWFRTTMDVPFKTEAFILNKGGIGSDNIGANLNYGLWMKGSQTIAAGFEDSAGKLHTVETTNAPASYVLYEWHYAMATYDGSKLGIHIDGVLADSKLSSNAQPDNSGEQPLRIGANSLMLNGFFIGDVDEIRIWNRALSDSEISEAYQGQFNRMGEVIHLGF